jgi:hypothetical protein
VTRPGLGGYLVVMRLSAFSLPLMLTTAMACGGSSFGPPAPRDCAILELAPGPPISAAQYDYVACASDGRVLLVGRLALRFEPDGIVTGTWEIDWAPGADRAGEVGPQVGKGELRGSLTDRRAWLDLNPGWADDNVFLAGDSGTPGIGGTWSWSTLTGPRAGGTFAARRR